MRAVADILADAYDMDEIARHLRGLALCCALNWGTRYRYAVLADDFRDVAIRLRTLARETAELRRV